MKKILIFTAAVVFLFFTLSGAMAFFAWNFMYSPASSQSQEIIYDLTLGKSFNTVASELEREGLIKNAEFFSLYAKVSGERSKIKVGEYALNTNMTPVEVMEVITSGKSIARAFTISEGLSIFEIAQLYEKQGYGTYDDFMSAVRDQALIRTLLGETQESLEGYLFPETYMITKFMSAKDLVTAMVKRFLMVYSQVPPQSKITGLNRHQIVTLASIIEKETGAPHERGLISSVFHNRMRKRMRLQTDPTVIYGKAVDITGRIVISITRQDLRTPTRYNTYVIPGLPPGPIANPGREALLAAVNPEASPYLFFVSQNDGTHIFTESYSDHSNAVKKFQLDPKAREGKSWRDLNKKTIKTETKKKTIRK